jgi:hypothetical protein
MPTTNPMPLRDALSGHVAALDTMIGLVGEHPALRGRVSLDPGCVSVGVETVVDFAAWGSALGVVEFTTWVDNGGKTALHLNAAAGGVQIVVVGDHPDGLPGVTATHVRLPLTVLDPSAPNTTMKAVA